jgi:hypothetical protein
VVRRRAGLAQVVFQACAQLEPVLDLGHLERGRTKQAPPIELGKLGEAVVDVEIGGRFRCVRCHAEFIGRPP